MLLEAESWEVDAGTEDFSFGKNTDSANAIDLHFHIWVTVGVAKVGQMRAPCSIFGVTLNDNRVLIKCIRQGKRCF